MFVSTILITVTDHKVSDIGLQQRSCCGVLLDCRPTLIVFLVNYMEFMFNKDVYSSRRQQEQSLDIIFCKHNSKNYEDSMGEFESPLWVRRWAYLKLRQEWTAG